MSGGVVVVGSLTVDVTAWSPRAPARGETVLGSDAAMVAGGKGANQAVAAARMGAPTWMVGCVGDDTLRAIVIDNLRSSGVRTDEVRTVASERTGLAHIRVEQTRGDNDIVIVPFANAAMDGDAAVAALRRLDGGPSVLLTQLEIPVDATAAALREGRAAGLTTILDPAPAAPLREGRAAGPTTILDPAPIRHDLWAAVDVVTPNETEASEITGVEVIDLASARRAAAWFVDHGVGTAVITLGAAGAVVVDARRSWHVAAPDVRPVDTTAAGDAFTGALGAALAAGATMERAVVLGVAAGSLAVRRAGASPSIPERDEVEEMAQRVPAPVSLG